VHGHRLVSKNYFQKPIPNCRWQISDALETKEEFFNSVAAKLLVERIGLIAAARN